MAIKKMSVLRREFISELCDLVNKTCLPAFVKVECMERALNEMRNIAEEEYQRDLQEYERGEDHGNH